MSLFRHKANASARYCTQCHPGTAHAALPACGPPRHLAQPQRRTQQHHCPCRGHMLGRTQPCRGGLGLEAAPTLWHGLSQSSPPSPHAAHPPPSPPQKPKRTPHGTPSTAFAPTSPLPSGPVLCPESTHPTPQCRAQGHRHLGLETAGQKPVIWWSTQSDLRKDSEPSQYLVKVTGTLYPVKPYANLSCYHRPAVFLSATPFPWTVVC